MLDWTCKNVSILFIIASPALGVLVVARRFEIEFFVVCLYSHTARCDQRLSRHYQRKLSNHLVKIVRKSEIKWYAVAVDASDEVPKMHFTLGLANVLGDNNQLMMITSENDVFAIARCVSVLHAVVGSIRFFSHSINLCGAWSAIITSSRDMHLVDFANHAVDEQFIS